MSRKIKLKIYEGHRCLYRQVIVVPDEWMELLEAFVTTSGAVAPHIHSLREGGYEFEKEPD